MENLNIKQLKALAKERSIKGYYKMRKADLIKALSPEDLIDLGQNDIIDLGLPTQNETAIDDSPKRVMKNKQRVSVLPYTLYNDTSVCRDYRCLFLHTLYTVAYIFRECRSVILHTLYSMIYLFRGGRCRYLYSLYNDAYVCRDDRCLFLHTLYIHTLLDYAHIWRCLYTLCSIF